MQVRIHAFELISPSAPISEFLEFLRLKSLEQFGDVFIPVTLRDGYYAGLVLAPKDMKAFCKFTKTAKKFEVKAEELAAGSNLADFNFFLVDPNTGRGIYSCYHHSTSLREFCYTLQRRWRDFKKHAVDTAIAALPSGHRKKDETAIQAHYKGFLQYAPIFKPSTFAERVEKMAGIKEFNFTFMGYAPVSGFTPVSGQIERVTAGFRFSQNANIKQLKVAIKSFMGSHPPKSASVSGVDENGADAVYRLYNDIETLEVFELDHFMSRLYIDSSDLDGTLQRSEIIRALIALAKSKDVKAIISAPRVV